MNKRRPIAGSEPLSISAAGLKVVRIKLLGGFWVSVGSRKIEQSEWHLKKTASLIKLLALAPAHRLHREQVMEFLWPGSGRSAASNNLRRILHVARKVLDPAEGSDYLASEDEQLVLCPRSELWVDVEAFEEAASAAHRTGDPAAYRAALDLYGGELLPADRYEWWAEGRRQELKQLKVELLMELARLYEQRGEYGAAIETLRRVLAQEPANEDVHAALMRLYALSERPAEALAQYERLEEVVSREFGTKPGAPTRRLREEIAAGEFTPHQIRSDAPVQEQQGPDASKHNLPAPRDSFVGRGREMLKLKRSLTMTRLLTLTGAGGSGKTRLALEIARGLVGAYPDGVWLVELATLIEGELVVPQVAGAVGVREQPGRSLTDTLVESLRDKRMLLVLDNCEHLVEEVADLVDTLLASCPYLRVLATSREPMNVAGEVVWSVPSLSIPDVEYPLTAEDLTLYESARLFVERALSRPSAFFLTAEIAHTVAEICQQLDGMPLAIELAAARVGTLAVAQISERLGDSLDLLTGGNRMAAPRQQTLRGTLDWSYNLLSEREKKLFCRLSTFAGGFTLEAAERVGAGEGVEEGKVLDLLGRLVDKSLVVTQAEPNESLRYRLLEPVRQYAWEKLDESGEAETVQQRHAEHFLALAERAEPGLKGARQGEWLKQLDIEHDNLRAALSWSLERGETELGLRLGGALGEFWYIHGYMSEGRRWLEAALTQRDTSSASARAKALFQAGYLATIQGDYELAVVLSEESLALYRRLGDRAGSATVLYSLGWVALFQNEVERASTLTEEAIALQREMNDRVGVVRSLLILGLVAILQRDYGGAMELHEEILDLAREAEDGFAIVLSLQVGAFAYLGRGDHLQTRALCEESLKLCRRLGLLYGIFSNLHIGACLASAQEQPVRSARLWGAAEALGKEIGSILSPVQRYMYRPYIDAARTQLDKAAWEAALAEGRAMSTEEAVEYALSEEDAATDVPRWPKQLSPEELHPSLTRREREVAALVARGHTNRQIAGELSISKHTVHHHLTKILKKLNLSSREQVASRLSGNW